MDRTPELTHFPVSLSFEAHEIAQYYSTVTSDSQKAKQVYLNMLAVYAVNFYLQCLGFETEWEKSDSCDRKILNLADTADLQIAKLGKLECRPVLPDSSVLEVPAETWNNRIGYVAVRLNESLKQAEIIGFIRTIAQSKGILPLSQLHPLGELIDCLHCLSEPAILSRWLDNLSNIYAGGWQTLQEFLGPDAPLMPVLMNSNSQVAGNTIKGAKLLTLGDDRDSPKVILLIVLIPQLRGPMKIRVQLHPNPAETCLPAETKLSVLSKTGQVQKTVRSRSIDNFIQLPPFQGAAGENFHIEIALDGFSLKEKFII